MPGIYKKSSKRLEETAVISSSSSNNSLEDDEAVFLPDPSLAVDIQNATVSLANATATIPSGIIVCDYGIGKQGKSVFAATAMFQFKTLYLDFTGEHESLFQFGSLVEAYRNSHSTLINFCSPAFLRDGEIDCTKIYSLVTEIVQNNLQNYECIVLDGYSRLVKDIIPIHFYQCLGRQDLIRPNSKNLLRELPSATWKHQRRMFSSLRSGLRLAATTYGKKIICVCQARRYTEFFDENTPFATVSDPDVPDVQPEDIFFFEILGKMQMVERVPNMLIVNSKVRGIADHEIIARPTIAKLLAMREVVAPVSELQF